MESGKKLQNYTLLSNCTPIGNEPPACPAGWISVGITQPGSCTIGNAPGDGVRDVYKMQGYNRVCKRRVPTTGDLAVDCCGNEFGISQSLECKTRGWNPYSWQCNSVMADRCNSNVQSDFAGPNWQGMPMGQASVVFNQCTGTAIGPPPAKQPGRLDSQCINYLKKAPATDYYATHNFNDTQHDFPKYGYSTPAFEGNSWGYQPSRKSYAPWNDYNHKNNNAFTNGNISQ